VVELELSDCVVEIAKGGNAQETFDFNSDFAPLSFRTDRHFRAEINLKVVYTE